MDSVAARCLKCQNSTALAEGTSEEVTQAMDISGILAEVTRAVTGARVITEGRHGLMGGGILAV